MECGTTPGISCEETYLIHSLLPPGFAGPKERSITKRLSGPTGADHERCENMQSPTYGLHVEQNGLVTMNGRPYYAAGINFYDGFLRYIGSAYPDKVPDSRLTMAKIARAKIPFIRTSLGCFRDDGVNVYLHDPREYFRHMDRFVRLAEEYRIGIVGCLFWSTSYAWIKALGAQENDMGDPESALIKAMLQYTRDVVSRYKDSPAMWGWETSNELNLAVDKPEQGDQGLKSESVFLFNRMISAEIRRLDPYRFISNGDAVYRKEQYSLKFKGVWQQDSEEEFRAVVPLFACGNIDTISIHTYAVEPEIIRFGNPLTVTEETRIYTEIARKAGKALFIGEFGCGADTFTEKGPAHLAKILEAIRETGVQLSACWNLDMADGSEDSFSDTGAGAYLFHETARMNDLYRQKGLQLAPIW